ncbi:MAG: polysaccharide deacetylase family protein [Theionarchaea archaeon]|nr:polysaccharide deacetylase family protein [Theionarchaea archaeon]MBU7000099.1 polysaccharide deacetylase family protein [Theionarchaea archaeon]MBU7020816.1 polysaccharide deacetylase family protein [Theionarchaea archaeon]MBU7033948.1 polysaccharide deacetylase family protein [Theionarchaea archaeon]MBU7039244.1 polysaccharide deacetylase family protein [Theionarchaea archaeon]
MNTLLLSFDLEEYDKAGEDGFEIGYRGGQVVRDLLRRTEVRATFFVTGSFYSRYSEFVAELSDEHEIAFHGLSHGDDYQSMSAEDALERLRTGKEKLEKGITNQVAGFRAPRMRPPSYAVLKSAGFLYSSSLHPTLVPGRYNHLGEPRIPFSQEGVLEIPVSVSPLARLPLSWVWFRQLGVSYAKIVTLALKSNYLAIYFHPWEFVPLTRGGIMYTRNTGEKMEGAVEKFLRWATVKAEPLTMGEYACQEGCTQGAGC